MSISSGQRRLAALKNLPKRSSKILFLARWRLFRKLKQDEVAARLSVSVTTISKWERGKSEPDGRYLQHLAGVYGCTVGDLYRDPEVPGADDLICDIIAPLNQVTLMLQQTTTMLQQTIVLLGQVVSRLTDFEQRRKAEIQIKNFENDKDAES